MVKQGRRDRQDRHENRRDKKGPSSFQGAFLTVSSCSKRVPVNKAPFKRD